MISKQDLIAMLDEEVQAVRKFGPVMVAKQLEKASELHEAKQALGVLQGSESALEAFKEKVIRWEDD